MSSGEGDALPGSEKEGDTMTRDEALIEVRRRAGGDLSEVPGPVIMRAVAMLMQQQQQQEGDER